VLSGGTILRRSFGKTEIGALFAGKINRTALASPAKITLDAKLVGDMLCSLRCSLFADLMVVVLSVRDAHYPLVLRSIRWFKRRCLLRCLIERDVLWLQWAWP